MSKKFRFKATIYKTGINTCVDVPLDITSQLTPTKGYIKIKGTVNGFPFIKTLVPFRNAPYRLFVNQQTLKESSTGVGDEIVCVIEQDENAEKEAYPVPPMLASALRKEKLTTAFNSLSEARQKDILKYLSFIKTESTMKSNIAKVIAQLHDGKTNVRIP